MNPQEGTLQKLMDKIAEWSDKTFGKGDRRAGMLAHLKKEIDELRAELFIDVREGGNILGIQCELADCLMLLLDIASHSGIDVESLLFETEHKLGINKMRKWGKINPDGSIEHVKP